MNRRIIAAATAASLLAFAMVGTQAAVSHADSASAPSAGPADSSTAPTDVAATAIATTYDHAVVVTGDESPTEKVTANPDGTMTLESNIEPVRVQQNGNWVPTNLDLQDSSGWVVPAATASPVRFSAGGTNVMAQVQTNSGDWVSETWPGGTLPAPQLSGSVATYPNVLPDVDLRLTATANGLAEVLVIQNAAAAANPALADLELGMPNATVSVNAQQTTVATAADKSVVTSAPPTWWDSSQPGANASGPGGAGEARPLPHTTDGDSVNLDVAAVTGQAPQYPIYVDPDWGPHAQSYWFTDRAYPSQSYLNGNASAGYQSVGYANQGGVSYMSRAFWQFPISPLEGKIIENAKFNVSVNYSCAATALDMSWYGPGTPGFTWNSDPGLYHSTEDSQTPPSVAGCQITPVTLGFNAEAAVSAFAADSRSAIQLALRADDESGAVTSRKHLGQDATLIVNYDTPPNTPSGLTIAAPVRACGGTFSTEAFVNGSAQSLVFTANTSDPDATNLAIEYQVYNVTSSGAIGTTKELDYKTGYQAEGAVTYTIARNTLADQGDFALRAETDDLQTHSNWTPWCYFHVDNDPPALPNMTLDSATPQIGKTVTATFTDSSPDIRAYVTWITPGIKPAAQAQPPVVMVTPSTTFHTCNPTASGETYICSTNNNAQFTYPVTDVSTTIYVAALDRAGNISYGTEPADNGPTVAASSGLSPTLDPAVSLTDGHSWLGDGSASTTITDLGTSTSSGVSAPTNLLLGTAVTPGTTGQNGRPNSTATPYPSTDLYFSGSPAQGTPASTSGPVVDQTGSFSVSAWLAPTSTAGTQAGTAVAETGASGPAFSLQQIGSQYQFCLKSQNTGVQQCVTSAIQGTSTDAWTFVTGIWDATSSTTGQMSIVIGANIENQANSTAARAPVTGDTAATGPLTVGAASTSDTSPWLGDIDGVTVIPGVPSTLQLEEIKGYGDPNHA